MSATAGSKLVGVSIVRPSGETLLRSLDVDLGARGDVLFSAARGAIGTSRQEEQARSCTRSRPWPRSWGGSPIGNAAIQLRLIRCDTRPLQPHTTLEDQDIQDCEVITAVVSSPNAAAAISRTERAFAAMKEGGAVVTWGDAHYGGDSTRVQEELRSGVQQIFSTVRAFAAVKEGGAVVTWGDAECGGDSTEVQEELRSGVQQIFSTERAFAAVKEGGAVVTWGDADYGGDSTGVQEELRSGVQQIFSTERAFAAMKEGGAVVTWGDADYGGDSTEVQEEHRSGVLSYALGT